MSERPIIIFPDTKLRTVCSPVSTFNEEILSLLDDMADTMYAANGIGLAAPQVGVLERIFIVDVEDKLLEFINPEITEWSGTEPGPDGCLSIPGIGGETYRSTKILVRAQDRTGSYFELEATGMLARCIQHENDHLNGVLFIDKATRLYEDEGEGNAEEKPHPEQNHSNVNNCTIQTIKLHHADFLTAKIRNFITEDLNQQTNAMQALLQQNPAQLKFTFNKEWVIDRRDLEDDMQHLQKISQLHTQKKLKKMRKK